MSSSDSAPLLSIVTPAFNESLNLPLLYGRLREVLDSAGIDWEWLVVDDHSSDATFDVLRGMAASDTRVRGIRFARNCGSHAAITCGLHGVRGRCVAILAADLQDPPEILPSLLEQWHLGGQVVWAVRTSRAGEKARTLAFSRLYYWIMRRVAGLPQMPASGADFWLMDRRVVNAFRQFGEANVSMMALITWMGFRQRTIEYTKEARLHGRSGWSLEKRLKLVIDSVTSFTYLPIRLISYVGFVVAVLGFTYALLVVWNAITGVPVAGWSSLMIVVLVLGGLQMLLMGILGEYVWRALDESRHRPRYLIEDATGPADAEQSLL